MKSDYGRRIEIWLALSRGKPAHCVMNDYLSNTCRNYNFHADLDLHLLELLELLLVKEVTKRLLLDSRLFQ